jgi:hypothetical protein
LERGANGICRTTEGAGAQSAAYWRRAFFEQGAELSTALARKCGECKRLRERNELLEDELEWMRRQLAKIGRNT